MPYPFSKDSKAKLDTAHPVLQQLFRHVSEIYNCKIIEGHRGEEAQNRYFEQGVSKVKFPDGKHNKEPSEAIDSGPYPIKWVDDAFLDQLTAGEREQVQRLCRWYHYCGVVKGVASELGISIRQGCDWNGNDVFTDQKFHDLPHTELKEE